MAVEQAPNLVTAGEVHRQTKIPIHVLYRMAKAGKIPYVDATEVWHEHTQYRFDVEQVRAAMADLAEQKRQRAS